MKYGQIVSGPAGSGKSTYCLEIYKYIPKAIFYPKFVNLDPSLDNMEYPNSIDIRKLVNLTEIMEEFNLGPNGALIFCIEYLIDNLKWLDRQFALCTENYFIFDLPGQIELYFHENLVKEMIYFLNNNYISRMTGLFVLDCQFITDIGKFFSGSILALACMLFLDLPHYNVLNKLDLIKNVPKKILQKFFYPNSRILLKELKTILNNKYKNLTIKISKILEDFSMIHYIPLDISCPDRMNWLLNVIHQSFEIE
nr:purine nucleotide-binding protein [Cryptomonas paramecium]